MNVEGVWRNSVEAYGLGSIEPTSIDVHACVREGVSIDVGEVRDHLHTLLRPHARPLRPSIERLEKCYRGVLTQACAHVAL